MADDKELRLRLTVQLDKFKAGLKGAVSASKDLGGAFRTVFRGATAPIRALGSVIGGVKSALRGLQTAVRAVGWAFGKLKAIVMAPLNFAWRWTKRLGLAVLATQAAIVAMAKSAANTGEELLAMSKRTGMSVKFLGEMKYVADQTEFSLEELQNAMKGLGVALQSARMGSKETIEAFKELKVSTLDANDKTKDSETLFWDLVFALQAVPNVLDRIGLAQKVFGRGAMSLMPLFDESKESLAKLRREGERHNIWTTKSARAADDFNDSLSSMLFALKSLKDTIGIAFFDLLTERFKRWDEWLIRNRGTVATWAEKAATHLSNVYDWLDKMAVKAGKIFVDLDWEKIKKNWRAALNELGAMFLVQGKKGLELGSFSQLIVDGIEKAIEKIRPIFDKFWTDVGQGFSLEVMGRITSLANSLRKTSQDEEKAAEEAQAKWFYKRKHFWGGAGQAGYVMPDWEKLSKEERAKYTEKWGKGGREVSATKLARDAVVGVLEDVTSGLGKGAEYGTNLKRARVGLPTPKGFVRPEEYAVRQAAKDTKFNVDMEIVKAQGRAIIERLSTPAMTMRVTVPELRTAPPRGRDMAAMLRERGYPAAAYEARERAGQQVQAGLGAPQVVTNVRIDGVMDDKLFRGYVIPAIEEAVARGLLRLQGK